MILGRSVLGRHVLGTLGTEDKAVVPWMEVGLEMDRLEDATEVSVIPDMTLELSMEMIFPELIQGGYLFVTVLDGGDEYNLSFEGIETE